MHHALVAAVALSMLSVTAGCSGTIYPNTQSIVLKYYSDGGRDLLPLGQGRLVRLACLSHAVSSNSTCTPAEPTFRIQYQSGNSTWLSEPITAADVPVHFKGHGREVYNWSLEYTIPTGCSTFLNLTFSATPQTLGLQCFTEDDTKLAIVGTDPEYSTTEAGLPRGGGNKYVVEEKVVTPGEVVFWDLGTGAGIDVECLDVHSVPLLNHSECRHGQYGAHGVPSTVGTLPAGEQFSLRLHDLPTCSPFTDRRTGPTSYNFRFNVTLCCSMTTKDECTALDNFGSPACVWIDLATGEHRCLPAETHGTVALNSVLGSRESLSFTSREVHKPTSSYIFTEVEAIQGWEGLNHRQWFLSYHNRYTNMECAQAVTISWRSLTNGGVCDPAGRAFCERRAQKCQTELSPISLTQWPQYWLPWRPAREIVGDMRYRTCNCLKELEVCYRKVGCTYHKGHQLVLQNCLEQECGNFCNHGSTLATSLPAVLAALLLLLAM